MKLIYIAGPYRAPTTWGIAQNIHRAREAGAIVAASGAYPVIPHSNTAHMDGVADDALWLAGTLELMRRCDGVVMAKGFMSSSGAVAEHNEAVARRMPIYSGGEQTTSYVPVEVVCGWSPWGFDSDDRNHRDALRDWLRLDVIGRRE
jgi:hypothetical protein